MNNERNEITLLAQGRLLKLNVCGDAGNGARGKRSLVTEFSRSSRLRLLQKMATIKPSKDFKAVFLTLTYGQRFPSPREAKRHLDSFLKRIARRYEKVSAFWRFDFQKRGAPHFHLLLFGLPFLAKETVKTWWGEIIGRDYWDYSRNIVEPPFTRIEFVRSHKQASSYVSKYVAKREGSGFNIGSYLTVEGKFIHPLTGEECGSIGRWWGVFNAEALPLADCVEIVANGIGMKAVMTLKRALAATRWRVDPDNRWGFFLFEDNPYVWVEYFEEMVVIS